MDAVLSAIAVVASVAGLVSAFSDYRRARRAVVERLRVWRAPDHSIHVALDEDHVVVLKAEPTEADLTEFARQYEEFLKSRKAKRGGKQPPKASFHEQEPPRELAGI